MAQSGLGKRIKAARKKAGMTLENVADCLGVSKQVVQFWETEYRTPTVANLKALADALLIEPGDLLNEAPGDGLGYEAKVSRSKELALLRLFRRLEEPAQDNLLQFLMVAADVSREVKQETTPATT